MIDFGSELQDGFDLVVPQYDRVVCLGDFNIDYQDSESPATKFLNNILSSYSLVQIISEPTRFGPSSATLLDLIICSTSLHVSDCRVHMNSSISDHCLISCRLRIDKPKLQPFFYTYRDFRNFDQELFLQDLSGLPLFRILYDNDINNKIYLFNNSILEVFNRHAPTRTVRVTRKPAPWLTDNLKFIMSLRDKALCKFKRNRNIGNWNSYTCLRNYTNQMIVNEKRAYLNHKIAVGGSRCLWKTLRDLDIYSKKVRSNLPPHLMNANEINTHFISSGHGISSVDETIIRQYNSHRLPGVCEVNFTPVDEDIIYELLLSMRSKAVGPDGLGINLLLHCCPMMLPYMTHILNFCLTESVFPDCWKLANILPLAKVDKPEGYNDLRPISILCTLSKILEKLIDLQLRDHVNAYNILPDNQSGFRPGFSCTTALLNITDEVVSNVDDGKLTLLILLDYSKAFDTINHGLLLGLLHYIGLSAKGVALIANYLSNREQRVSVGGTYSDCVEVTAGVPQGSVLGPLLFTIYTSQLEKHIQFCNSHFYADDTQLYMSFAPAEVLDACERINIDLENLAAISNKYCLSINPAKSKVILFGPQKSRNSVTGLVNISVSNQAIPLVQSARSLGVEIDSSLRFDEHVNHMIRKAVCSLKLLYSSRQLLSKRNKILLCESLVLSHLNYADVVYGPCLTALNCQRLQRIQNSCIRLIFGLRKYDHVSDRFTALRWLNMTWRRRLHGCVLYHKVLSTKCPAYLYNKIGFRTDVHHLNLRHKNFISVPKHKTTVFRRSFSYNVANCLNSLSVSLRGLNTEQFRFRIKSQFLRECETGGW